MPYSRPQPLDRSDDRGRFECGEPAALVVEIVSPDDETWQKLPFYAAHGVDEVLIVDPGERSVHWLARSGGEYREAERSGLVELGPNSTRPMTL